MIIVNLLACCCLLVYYTMLSTFKYLNIAVKSTTTYNSMLQALVWDSETDNFLRNYSHSDCLQSETLTWRKISSKGNAAGQKRILFHTSLQKIKNIWLDRSTIRRLSRIMSNVSLRVYIVKKNKGLINTRFWRGRSETILQQRPEWFLQYTGYIGLSRAHCV